MNLPEAIKILELHNKWRRGADIKQQTPTKIGIAIDTVLSKVKNIQKAEVKEAVCKHKVVNTVKWACKCVNCGIVMETIK